MDRTHISILLLICPALVWIDLGSESASAAPTVKSEQWGVLIGIEKYRRASRLRYTINDVEQLAYTLEERGGYRARNILKMVDTNESEQHQPLRASLLRELPKWLAKPQADDTMIVYFSGHGVRDRQDGKLYLAPIDCDPTKPASTGVSVEWLRREIAACRAKVKLLVIDACHAGTEKGLDDEEDSYRSVAAKELGAAFEELTGVITLASSTNNEKSQIWDEKEQSLFSYWLNQGLKGHADRDDDGNLTIDELYRYVHRNVTHTARTRMPRPQTPVRIVRSGTIGVPVIVQLRPQTLRLLLEDVAQELSWAMQEHQLPRVGVLEFTNDTKLGELLGANFGLLGRYCAEELQERLADRGSGHFKVVSRKRLQKTLSEHGFTLDDTESADALRKLSADTGGMPAVAMGTLRSRFGRVVSLRVNLTEIEEGNVSGSAGGTAKLNEHEWAMLGRSVAVRPQDHIPNAPSVDEPVVATEENRKDQLIDRLDRRSEGPHPLKDPKFQFPIKIVVDGKERKGVFRANDYYVPLESGETYAIRVENRADRVAMMRLLVDGLNTLPQAVGKGVQTLEVAPRVNFNDARAWVLDPAKRRSYVVKGFFTSTGARARYRSFEVVEAGQGIASRRNYTDQIGLITAVFYDKAAEGTTRGADRETRLGREGQTTVGHYRAKVGDLLAVVNIRYMSPEAVRQIAQ